VSVSKKVLIFVPTMFFECVIFLSLFLAPEEIRKTQQDKKDT
jgi:hypothetical protein